MSRDSSRERILDAFEELVISQGERAATLEAVAAAADISKGGLLYHFNSRDALAEGLLERFHSFAAAHLAAMKAAPEGPSLFYLRTSGTVDGPFDRTIMALLKLLGPKATQVHDAFSWLQRQWLAHISEDLQDPALAQAVMLMGDGLYYNASLHGQRLGVPGSIYELGLEAIWRVVERARSRE